ncbi:MAG TPA: transposase [Gemmatimonadales bacterium]|nr:transposase [Gemmatimonadales bacterium]
MSRRYEPLVDGRESIRLDGYDYARTGAYFVTCCVERRKRLLGTVRGGVMQLSAAGRMVMQAWHRLPAHYPHVELDAFVVMPNHVHGIIVLGSGNGGNVGMDRDVGTDRDVGEDRDVGMDRDVGTDRDVGRDRDVGMDRDVGTDRDVGMDRDVGTDRDVGMNRDVGKVGAGLRPAPTVAPATIPTSRDVPPVRGVTVAPATIPTSCDVPPVFDVTVAPATIPTLRDVPMHHRRHALPEIVRAFKSFSARAINQHRGTPGARVWQRNYYERIIRDQHQFEATRRYIRDNPAKWGDDRSH